MKTNNRTVSLLGLISPARRLLPVVAAVAATLASAAAPEPKTHTLFMGADFSVEQNQHAYRVLAVTGDSFLIKVDGKEVRVPLNQESIALKIDPLLKLTELSADVANLTGRPAYTLGRDPTVVMQRSLAKSQLLYSDAQYASGLASANQQNALNKQVPNYGSAGANAYAAAVKAAQVAATTRSLTNANAGAGANSNALSIHGGTGSDCDAMDIAFDVSSERPLEHAYVVVVVQFRPPEGQPGRIGNWVYARALPPIGRTATKVHIAEGGLPPGFELQDFQVHLYNRGDEIATPVAPKRVALTRTEANAYLTLNYLGSHKGDTLPAAALGRLSRETSARLDPAQLGQTYFVKVSPDGRPLATFLDAACSRPAGEKLAEAIETLRFYPALEKGKPVPGLAELHLATASL